MRDRHSTELPGTRQLIQGRDRLAHDRREEQGRQRVALPHTTTASHEATVRKKDGRSPVDRPEVSQESRRRTDRLGRPENGGRTHGVERPRHVKERAGERAGAGRSRPEDRGDQADRAQAPVDRTRPELAILDHAGDGCPAESERLVEKAEEHGADSNRPEIPRR